MATTLVDGAFVSNENFGVAPLDRAVLYGESAFEMIRVYQGHAFEWERHLDLLERTCDALGLTMPRAELNRDVNRLTMGDAALRIVITKGNPELGISSRRIVHAADLALPARELYVEGATARVERSFFLQRRAPFVGHKWGGYGANLAVRARAQAEGAHEALLVNETGEIVEGATSNVFAVCGNTIVTAPESSGIRAGVTRSMVLAIAAEEKMEIRLAPIGDSTLAVANEVFLASSIREILPLAKVDDRMLGSHFDVARSLHRAIRKRANVNTPMPWED